jgi:hypothetical protein
MNAPGIPAASALKRKKEMTDKRNEKKAQDDWRKISWESAMAFGVMAILTLTGKLLLKAKPFIDSPDAFSVASHVYMFLFYVTAALIIAAFIRRIFWLWIFRLMPNEGFLVFAHVMLLGSGFLAGFEVLNRYPVISPVSVGIFMLMAPTYLFAKFASLAEAALYEEEKETEKEEKGEKISE